MIIFIVFTIFIFSLVGITFILYKKMPELLDLPANGRIGIAKPGFISKFEGKVKKISENFQKHILLHKFLFSVKCIISKTEHKIDNWLHNIRKKAQQKNKK